MRRAVRRTTEPVFAEQHAELVDILAPLDIAQTKIACRVWRERAEAVVDPAPKPVAPAEVTFGVDDNGQLALMCSRHHHLIHQPGWTLTLQPDGTLTIVAPDGTTRISRPRGSPPTLPLFTSAA